MRPHGWLIWQFWEQCKETYLINSWLAAAEQFFSDFWTNSWKYEIFNSNAIVVYSCLRCLSRNLLEIFRSTGRYMHDGHFSKQYISKGGKLNLHVSRKLVVRENHNVFVIIVINVVKFPIEVFTDFIESLLAFDIKIFTLLTKLGMGCCGSDQAALKYGYESCVWIQLVKDILNKIIHFSYY